MTVTEDGLGSFGGLVQLALLTAMRRGELSGLRWSDIKAERVKEPRSALAASGRSSGSLP